MDKVTDIKIESYDYADLYKEYGLADHYQCVNKFNIVNLVIKNTDMYFVNTIRRIMIANIPSKRFECVNNIQINNGLVNYIIAPEIIFRLELLQLSYDIDSNLIFELKYKNTTPKPVVITSSFIKCKNNPKVKITDYINYIDNILTLQPGGYIDVNELIIVENNTSHNSRFSVVSTCGFKCLNFDKDNKNLEVDVPNSGRDYKLNFRYCEKYGLKELFEFIKNIMIIKLNNIVIEEYDNYFILKFNELYTISAIIIEELFNIDPTISIKQNINDEENTIYLVVYDNKNLKHIDAIIKKSIVRIKAFVEQF